MGLEPERMDTGKTCEVDGSPHKGEEIIEISRYPADFGGIADPKERVCRYYQECYLMDVKCGYTEKIDI
jgi:hypothetical protein